MTPKYQVTNGYNVIPKDTAVAEIGVYPVCQILLRFCFFVSFESTFKALHLIFNVLTLSSPGFFGSSQPGGGGGGGHKVMMMKLGKLVKCLKLYLMMGFWCVNWL